MRIWLMIAGVAGAYGVGFGAYAAHGFEVGSYEAVIGEKAAHFALWHALALLAADRLIAEGRRMANLSAFLFSSGILFFSGSLTLKALTGALAWPLITPLGGVCFVGGWVVLAMAGVMRGR
ncbi:MAG: DUF423 domain-containing protein [Alphaproteobacteria bacterium]|nr:DUF423 domain-containing protein [Alphaproteobacteria bacterium]